MKVSEGSRRLSGVDDDAHAHVSRALTTLAASGDGAELAQRIGDIAGGAVLRYEPIWRPHESYMCGYLATRPAGPDRVATEDLSWEDLILMGAATRSLRQLMAGGSRSILLLPLSVGTLGMRIGELYCYCFCALPPWMRRYIVLELGNMPVHGLSAPVEEKIKNLADQCRAVVINTSSPLRKYDPDRFLKVQAYGFSLRSSLCKGQDVASLCDRFRAQYHRNCRLYITGVDSAEALQAAIACKFSYISGQAVAASQSRMEASRFLRARDVAANTQPILEMV